jgi:1,2-diacylglycerol 3-alpha-glucosyltransferase
MNIGVVTTWFERGAAYVSKQYVDLLKEEHNVFIYARDQVIDSTKDNNWNRYNVEWQKGTMDCGTASCIDLVQFKKWLINNNIETVFFNEQHWFPPILLCRDLKIKVGSYIDYYKEDTIKYFDLYDFLICNTKKHFSVFSEHKQVFYVPWGTDTELFSLTDKKENLDRLDLFFSGGYNPVERKGLDLLLRAFNLVKKHNVFLHIHTQISLKDCLNKDDFEILNECIKDNKIQVYHKTIHAPGMFYVGDVYVYPTRLEGIGLTIIEALSSGLPVIVPDEDPMTEFIDGFDFSKKVKIHRKFCRSDGYYWPLVEIDVNDLADKILFYINNINEIHLQKKITRELAVKKFTWNNNRNQICKIFTDTNILIEDSNMLNLRSQVNLIYKKAKFYRSYIFIKIIKKILYK